MKYIILAYSNDVTFDKPRQLVEVNGEPLVKRTIRLLKENGINDILITAKDKRFDNLGATKYEPLHNSYDYVNHTGYWIDAFPIELLNEPICFVWGDVYFSENAIKKIVETKTKSTLFFCAYNNNSNKYIKEHDEPLAYKVVDYELFKEKIKEIKKLKDQGKCCREPIVWELYRLIHNQDINEHIMTTDYVAINDESCDVDSVSDLEKIKEKLEANTKGGNKMVKCVVLEEFTLGRFDELKNIKRAKIDTYGRLYVNDEFECSEEIAKYLTGENVLKKTVVKIIEVEPVVEKLEAPKIKLEIVDEEVKPKKKKFHKK